MNSFKKYTSEETFNKIVDFNSVSQMWEFCVKQYSTHEAIKTENSSITYSELDEEVAKFRSVLKESNISTGDKVGVYLPNSIEFAKAFLAITSLGAVAVLLPTHLDNMTLFGCSMKLCLKAIVYKEESISKFDIVSAKNPNLSLIDISSSKDYLTPSVNVEPNSPCAILFTAGTTGQSKGSLLSNKAIMQGTKNGCYGYENVFDQRYFLILPLTHVFGLIRNLLTSLYTGSTIYICSNNQNMFRDIQMFKPTILVLVPALAQMALNLSTKFKRNMLGDSVKTIICGAAFVPPFLIKEYSKLNIALLPGYGLTESANLVSGNAEAIRKPDSVGIVYPGIMTKVVDGELWLKGDTMQECYFNEQAENEKSYEDGWFKTGDLVRFDEEGYLYITGRKKEIIVLSTGENVSPQELEAIFSKIDLIEDCLVYENDLGLLELEVFIRSAEAQKQEISNPEEVIKKQVSEINETLPSYERITKVVFRDVDFVRSPSMKIVRSKNGNVKK